MSLVLKSITKVFSTKGAKNFSAVDNLTLHIQKGQFYTLLGPSGCGKTTLLRMIAGFEHPTTGEITYKGNVINNIPAHKRGFPMVFQSYALFPHMNVFENIAYGLKLKKDPKNLSKAQIKERVEKIIKLLELNEQTKKYPFQMSGGQQQRVALARALVLEPEIILFDEPLSNLDAKLRLSMRNEIRNLQKRLGITTVYVTHDQEEAMAISDQIVVLNHGSIEQMGSPQEIYQKPATQFVANFVGAANVFEIQALNEIEFQLFGANYNFIDNHRPKHVVIRPESIKLSKAHGRHKAHIEDSVFLGSRVQYTLNCNGTKFALDVAWSGKEPLFNRGDDVTFELDSKELHFI
jgi:iron(III) transport system ATP-binding protein